MSHRGTLFGDHKKTFSLAPTSSSPYFATGLFEVSPITGEVEEAAGVSGDPLASRAPGFGFPGAQENLYQKINLAEIPDVERADNFRVGMNFIWREGSFGLSRDRRVVFSATPISSVRVGSPSELYAETFQYGYGLSLLTKGPGNRRALLATIFDTSLPQPPLGNPTKTHTNSNSITASYRTRQEFRIAPPFGVDGTAIQVFDADGTPPPSWWTDGTDWQLHIENNIVGSFEDFAFSMDAPFPIEKVEQSYGGASSIRDIYVDIKPSYNFHIPSYENIIPTITSSLIPNMYVFASENDDYFTDELNSRFKQHIEFGNLMPEGRVFTDILKGGKKTGEADTGQYFQLFAETVEKYNRGAVANPPIAKLTISNLGDKYKNIAVPMSNLNILKDNESKAILFPMNMKVEFSTDVNTLFADAISDNNLFSTLITNLVDNENYQIERADWNFKNWSNIPEFYDTSVSRKLALWDMGKWIDDVLLSNNGPFQSSRQQLCDLNVVLLGKGQEEIVSAQQPEYQLYTKLMVESLKKQFEGIIETKFRSFADLVQGKEAYNETLFYSISRLKQDGAGWNLEQRIWLPNSNEIDVLKYIDTQVKYNTPYRYVVVAYQLILGNKYEYQTKALTALQNNKSAELCLFNEPSLNLAVIPYYDTLIDHPEGIIILDKPPVPPNVNVVPYKGVDNKVLVWLNGNVGEFWQPDIRIFPQELSERNNSERNKFGEIYFKSDDPVSKFEIFRTNKRPKTYQDFSKMEEPFIVETMGASSAAFEDTIRPNQKYYYTFRSVDSHNQTSNPSPVYEVELVKNDENVFALINIVDMGLPPVRQTAKPGRRFIEIKPSLFQTVLDVDSLQEVERLRTLNMQDINQYAKFIAEESVWGSGFDKQKKYKVRLNSKTSGKKIDINLKFKFQVSGSV